MIVETEERVSFSRKTWDDLRQDDYFREVIEIIEAREALEVAKQETTHFVDLDEYYQQKNIGKYYA